MIFVTVGTHEQGMERLFRELDRLIEEDKLDEKVVAQIGYSKYIPENYEYKTMIGYSEMNQYIKHANIIITHGGPGSIFQPLHYGKIPIVVPRNPKFNEHVDNHQILFTKRLEKERRVLAVYDIEELNNYIINYDELIAQCVNKSNENNKFIDKFDKLISNLMIK